MLIIQQTLIWTNFRTALRYWIFWGYSSGVSLLGYSQLCKNLCLNCLFLTQFLIIVVPIFFCEQDNLLGGQFWAMGRLNLLGGQINLQCGQMPTQQLTCYLPPCLHVGLLYTYPFHSKCSSDSIFTPYFTRVN